MKGNRKLWWIHVWITTFPVNTSLPCRRVHRVMFLVHFDEVHTRFTDKNPLVKTSHLSTHTYLNSVWSLESKSFLLSLHIATCATYITKTQNDTKWRDCEDTFNFYGPTFDMTIQSCYTVAIPCMTIILPTCVNRAVSTSSIESSCQFFQLWRNKF